MGKIVGDTTAWFVLLFPAALLAIIFGIPLMVKVLGWIFSWFPQ